MSILRKPIHFVFLTSLICLVLGLPVLNAQSDTAEHLVIIPEGETVKIGLATDLSNLLPAPGLDVAQAAELAVVEYNDQKGGLNGFEVELVIEDDLCTADGAESVANDFVEIGDIVAVVGHLCSGASIPASEIYEEARIPMVSASSTSSAFTARGLDVVNRTVFNDNIQGVVAGRFIKDVIHAQKVAVLHNSTAYGVGLAQTVTDTLEDLGVEIAVFEGIDMEGDDYTNTIRKIAVQNVDLVYFGGYEQEGSRLVEQLRRNGLGDAVFFSGDGIYTPDFLKLADQYAEGVYVTFGTQVGDPVAIEAFENNYADFYGINPSELGPYHAQAYDATNIILNALEEVVTVDDDGSLVINRDELIDAIRDTRRYHGLSGTITCNDNGDCGSAVINVYRVLNGAWVEQDVPVTLQVQVR